MKKVLKNCTLKRKWNFKTKGELIYIQSDSTKKVLGTANGIKVIEEEFQEGKSEQLWKVGEATAEGYFTLENYKLLKLLTVITPFHLRIEGNFDGYSSYFLSVQ